MAVDMSSHRMRTKFKFGAFGRCDGECARILPSGRCPSFEHKPFQAYYERQARRPSHFPPH